MPADQVEYRKSVLVGDDRLAVDETGACRQCRDRRGGHREAPSKIVAVSSEEPHVVSDAPRHDAEAVMLDLVNPIPAGRRLIGRAVQAWLDEVGQGAGTRTRQHTVKLAPLAAES